jgi:23S rRNA (guanosine2251-2'-O)-methyltransferase
MTDHDDIQFLSGIQPVLEALRHRRRPLYSLSISRKKDAGDLIALAEALGIQIREAETEKVGQLAGTTKHQGVALECGPLPVYPLEELLRFELPAISDLLVLLAGVEDPRNLGAVARTCSFLGVRALVLPSRGTAPLSPTASRSSAGALESLPVYGVKSAPVGCESLSDAGYEVVGVELEGELLSDMENISSRTVLVFGSEDRALPPRVRAACTRVVTIEGKGPTGSLNLSVAAGIAIYEVKKAMRSR